MYTHIHMYLRSEEVEKMRAEQQRLFRELHRHSQSVKTSMEATEQTAKADREQVCHVALSFLCDSHYPLPCPLPTYMYV